MSRSNETARPTTSEEDRGSEGRVPCDSCGRPLERGVSLGDSDSGRSRWKCVRCALFDAELAARSGRVAAVVGTVLVALNQGDQLVSGQFDWASAWWKIPLTYLVPFLVASYGAISNGHRPAETGECDATGPESASDRERG